MRPPIEFLFPQELGSELIYSFVIIICSLMIYYATKEMYELSSHKGIRYFRLAFLFFAIAYFSRYFIVFLLNFLNLDSILFLSPRNIFPASIFIFIYSSTMAIMYLLYSVMWKKWNNDTTKIYLFNIISLIIAFIGMSFNGMFVSFIWSIIFFLSASFILFMAYIDSKKKQKGIGLLRVYLLLFVFSFFNVINILLPNFLQLYKIGIYLISILIFMVILYKVLKKVGN